MKKLLCLGFTLVLCFCMISCGQSKNSDMLYSGSEEYDGNLYYESSGSVFQTTAIEGYKPEYNLQDSADELPVAPMQSNNVGAVLSEEKLVYTVDITLETETFETSMDALHQSITGASGIVISESAYNLGGVNPPGTRTLNLTVKVPRQNYESFLGGLSADYNVSRLQSNVENLTARYYDNENRLKSYRIQEERLFEMLEAAENVSDMLQIESRLSDVQYQIEALENTQRTIDTDVAYATFYITLEEVTKYTPASPKNFGERIAEAFSGSIENFGAFLETLLISLLYLLPYLGILAVILLIILFCYKHSRKKFQKQQKNASENQPPDHTP